MTTTGTTKLMRGLQRIALTSNGAGLTDGHLLDRFLCHHDEMAFEMLVRRHGPMVFAVCKRVGGNLQDAEDAFQACFLVLARKAASVLPREAVGNWLYGVAYRTARRARALRARRWAREKQVKDMPHRATESEDHLRELEALLDQEISHLPDKYRLSLVLCELEGRPRKEVARQLKIPEGTLSSRLATARKKLAARLTRRGVTLGAAALTAVLAPNAVSASMPRSLVHCTVRAACLIGAGEATTSVVSTKVAALTEGVLKTMLLTKLKIGAAVLVMFTLAMAQGYSLSSPPLQAEPPQEKKALPGKSKGPLDPKPDAVTRPTVPVRKPDAVTPPIVPVQKPEVPKLKQGRIRGRFTAADTGKPVAGARLRVLIDGLPDSANRITEGISDADGRYTMEVPLGHCHLWGVRTPSGYFTQDSNARGPILTTRTQSEVVRNFVLQPGSPWQLELHGAIVPKANLPLFMASAGREGQVTLSASLIDVEGDLQGKATLTLPSAGGRYGITCGLQRRSPSGYEIPSANPHFSPRLLVVSKTVGAGPASGPGFEARQASSSAAVFEAAILAF